MTMATAEDQKGSLTVQAPVMRLWRTRALGLGLRAYRALGLGLRVWGLGLRVYGLGFRAKVLGLRALGLGVIEGFVQKIQVCRHHCSYCCCL